MRHIDNHGERLILLLGSGVAFYSSIYGATYIWKLWEKLKRGYEMEGMAMDRSYEG